MRTVRGYELRDRIGSSQTAEVYRAYQPSVGKEVAVKVIRGAYSNQPGFVRRFEQEAHTVANLAHPHIVPLLDFWRDPDGAFLVSPLMRGGNLADVTGGGWSLGATLRFLDQVGGALGYAHRQGLIHGNVKPTNILFDGDDNAYLADFGTVGRGNRQGEPGFETQVHGAPEVVRGGANTVRSDIHDLGVVTHTLLTGIAPGADLSLPRVDDVRPEIPSQFAAALARALAENPADRFERVDEFLRAVRRSLGADVVAVSSGADAPAEAVRNPYKGLQAFGEADSFDFHGRGSLVDDLLQVVATHTLTAVVGPSGSGKSSLVRAGLIPALRAGGIPGSRSWLVTDMFPGSYPFEELEAALLRVAVDRPAGLLGALLEENGLLRVSKQILPGDDSTLLLVIDQFEELFSLVRSEQLRRLFLDNLTAVARDERSRVRVLLTLRADFLDRPLSYGEFADVLGEGLVAVGPPTRDGLARAVAAPARNVGIELEPGLVGRVVADVENQPGGLPLLQYALTEMFNHRRSDVLTIEDYESTGGVVGALGRRAEELYKGLSNSGQEAARQLFLRLVTVDENSLDSRRRARQSELQALAVDQQALDTAIQAYGGFRLLSFDRDPVTRGPTVEVAHEALLREWPRLAAWIDDERESLLLARRLSAAARDWMEADQDPSFLLRGARLDQTTQWLAVADVALTEEERSYVDRSIAQRETDRIRERRRRRRTVVMLSTSLVAVTLAGAVALVQRDAATAEARDSRIRELAVESLAAIEEDPELAVLIALEAVDISERAGTDPLPEAIGALHQASQQTRLVRRIDGPSSTSVAPVQILATAPDGTRLATVEGEGTVTVTDPNGASPFQIAAPGPGLAPVAVIFAPDGAHLAVSYGTPSGPAFRPAPRTLPDVVVYDVTTGEAVARITIDGGAHVLDFSPDGTRLAAASSESVSIVDWRTGDEIVRVGSDLAPPIVDGNSASSRFGFGTQFLGDGEVVAVAVRRAGIALYSTATGERVELVDVPEMGALLASSPDHRRLAFVAAGRLHVYDWETKEVRDLGPSDPLVLAWSPDGEHVAFAGFDSAIQVVDADSGDVQLQLAGSRDNIFGLAYLDDETLANVAFTEILFWDVSVGGRPELGTIRPSIGPQWGYQISPDGSRLGTFSLASASFELLDMVTGESLAVMGDQALAVDVGVRTISTDFALVGSLEADGRSTVRALPSLDVVAEFEPCRNPAAFTPDNTRVLVSGNVCPDAPAGDDPSQVLDLATGEVVVEIPHRWVFSSQFNPEGEHPGGRYLAVTDQSVVDIYDVASGERLGRLTTAELLGFPLAMSFDPNGRYLAGGLADGSVWVLDMNLLLAGSSAEQSLVFRQRAHTGAAPWPALTADGRLATAGFDGLVRVWDIHSGELLVEFRAEVDIPVVAFSPDGSTLFYPDGGSIARFPMDPDRLVDLARSLLTRDFAAEECPRYRDADLCA